MEEVTKYILPDELYHHGVKGMKWGVRRYQNADGTLNTAGKRHQAKVEKRQATRDYNKAYNKAYNYSGRHYVSQFFGKHKQVSDDLWNNVYDKAKISREKDTAYKLANAKYKNERRAERTNFNENYNPSSTAKKIRKYANTISGVSGAAYMLTSGKSPLLSYAIVYGGIKLTDIASKNAGREYDRYTSAHGTLSSNVKKQYNNYKNTKLERQNAQQVANDISKKMGNIEDRYTYGKHENRELNAKLSKEYDQLEKKFKKYDKIANPNYYRK